MSDNTTPQRCEGILTDMDCQCQGQQPKARECQVHDFKRGTNRSVNSMREGDEQTAEHPHSQPADIIWPQYHSHITGTPVTVKYLTVAGNVAVSGSDVVVTGNDVALMDKDVTVMDKDDTVMDKDVTVMDKDVEVMDKNVTVMDKDVTVMDNDVTVMDKDVEVMEKNVTVMDNDVTVMDSDVMVMDKDVTVMDNDVTVMDSDVMVMDKVVEVMDNNVTVMDKDVTVMDNDVTVMDSDVMVMDKDVTEPDKDVAVTNKDLAVLDNDVTVMDKDVEVMDKDVTVMDNDVKDVAVMDKDVTVTDKDVTVSDKDVTVTDKDVTVSDRDVAVPDADVSATDSVSRGFQPSPETKTAAFNDGGADHRQSERDTISCRSVMKPRKRKSRTTMSAAQGVWHVRENNLAKIRAELYYETEVKEMSLGTSETPRHDRTDISGTTRHEQSEHCTDRGHKQNAEYDLHTDTEHEVHTDTEREHTTAGLEHSAIAELELCTAITASRIVDPSTDSGQQQEGVQHGTVAMSPTSSDASMPDKGPPRADTPFPAVLVFHSTSDKPGEWSNSRNVHDCISNGLNFQELPNNSPNFSEWPNNRPNVHDLPNNSHEMEDCSNDTPEVSDLRVYAPDNDQDSTADHAEDGGDNNAGCRDLDQTSSAGCDDLDRDNGTGFDDLDRNNSAGYDDLDQINSAGCDDLDWINSTGCDDLDRINSAGCDDLDQINSAGYDDLDWNNSAGCDYLDRINSTGYDNLDQNNCAGCDDMDRNNSAGCDDLDWNNSAGCDDLDRNNSAGYDDLDQNNSTGCDDLDQNNSAGYDDLDQNNSAGYDDLDQNNSAGCDDLDWNNSAGYDNLDWNNSTGCDDLDWKNSAGCDDLDWNNSAGYDDLDWNNSAGCDDLDRINSAGYDDLDQNNIAGYDDLDWNNSTGCDDLDWNNSTGCDDLDWNNSAGYDDLDCNNIAGYDDLDRINSAGCDDLDQNNSTGYDDLDWNNSAGCDDLDWNNSAGCDDLDWNNSAGYDDLDCSNIAGYADLDWNNSAGCDDLEWNNSAGCDDLDWNNSAGYDDLDWYNSAGYDDLDWNNSAGYDDLDWNNIAGYDDLDWNNIAGYDDLDQNNSAGCNDLDRNNSADYDDLDRNNSANYDDLDRNNSAGYDNLDQNNSAGYDHLDRNNSAGCDDLDQKNIADCDYLSRNKSADCDYLDQNSSTGCDDLDRNNSAGSDGDEDGLFKCNHRQMGTVEQYDLLTFNSSLTHVLQILATPHFKVQELDVAYPEEDLMKLLKTLNAGLADYRQKAQVTHNRLSDLQTTLKHLHSDLCDGLTRSHSAHSHGLQESPSLPLLETQADLNQSLVLVARAQSQVADARLMAAEVQASVDQDRVAAEQALEESRRIEEELLLKEQLERKRQKIEEKLRLQEEQRRLEEEAKRQEEEKRAQEILWQKQQEAHSQCKSLSTSFMEDDLPILVYQEEERQEGGAADIICIIRAKHFKQAEVSCKVMAQDHNDVSLRYKEQEELISKIVYVHPKNPLKEQKMPFLVALPCLGRMPSSREPVMKALMNGVWEELITTEVNFDGYKEYKFAQAEVEEFTKLVLMSRFKRDYIIMEGQQPHKVCSSYDPRVSLTSKKDSFLDNQKVVLIVQPVESSNVTEFRQNDTRGKRLLSSSPVLHMDWDSCSVFNNAVTITLPCPPNPVKAHHLAMGKKKEDQKSTPKAAAAPVASEDPLQTPKQKSKISSRPQSKVPTDPEEKEYFKPTKWYMGQYAEDDDGESDQAWLITCSNSRWNPDPEVSISQPKIDLVTFDLCMPCDRVMVVRTLLDTDEDCLRQIAVGLMEQLGRRPVHIYIKQNHEDPYDVICQLSPTWNMERVTRELMDKGFTEGPSKACMSYLCEGDCLILEILGNLKFHSEVEMLTNLQKHKDSKCGKENVEYRLTYNSNLPTTARFYVIEKDRYLQRNFDMFRGAIQVRRQHLPSVKNRRTSMRDTNQAPKFETEIICLAYIDIPKFHLEPDPTPNRAPVMVPSNGMLTNRQLTSVADDLGDEWYDLATKLQIQSARVQAIIRTSMSYEMKDFQAKYEMLLTWFKRCPQAADKITILANALQAVGRRDLATMVRKRSMSCISQMSSV